VSLGHSPAFPAGVPYTRPSSPPLEDVVARLAPSYASGVLTDGPLVRLLEEQCAARLGVAHVVAVSSATTGLMLAVKSLDLSGKAVVPSFTFSASAHALAWNGLQPVFSECDPRTLQIDVEDAADRLAGAAMIMATHIFGAPCQAERVEWLAQSSHVPAIFDAAHAFGATRRGRPLGGFGSAEVFSLSPTKPLVAGEGGLVATDDDHIAEAVRHGRNYGNPGDYDTRFVGLNARMSEFHAAMALEGLEHLDANLERRKVVAARYASGLQGLPGVTVQAVDVGDESTWKDFTVLVDSDAFGMDRDALALTLRDEGVDTRRYFWPPVHRQSAYQPAPAELPVTDRAAGSTLNLPMFTALDLDVVDVIVDIVWLAHAEAERLCSIMAKSA
jgi:dTDP-4-amino-4,6-dideoxygalactose transaminase